MHAPTFAFTLTLTITAAVATLVLAQPEAGPDVCSQADSKAWLVIGIPTMPRPSGADYLTRVVSGLWEAVRSIDERDPLYGRVIVLVANMRPGETHKAYEKLRDGVGLRGGFGIETEAELAKYHMYFRFVGVDSSVQYRDDRPGKADAGTPDIPGYRVRRQTRDVAGLVDAAKGLAHYFMFSEDDFSLCPNGLMALQYVIGKANRLHPEWSGIRTSFGLAGWVLKDSDLPGLSAFMVKHQWRRPPDHLVTEFAMGTHPDSLAHLAGAGTGMPVDAGVGAAAAVPRPGPRHRFHMAFRHNLMLHLGEESVLGHDDSAMALHYPLCFQDLRAPPLWKGEEFEFGVCWDDDLSPCHFRNRRHRKGLGHVVREPNTQGQPRHHHHRLTDWMWLCVPTLYPDALPPFSLMATTLMKSHPWVTCWLAVAGAVAVAVLVLSVVGLRRMGMGHRGGLWHHKVKDM